MTDPQIIQRLNHLSTDAYLSGDITTARTLAEAVARLTELSIIHDHWNPRADDSWRTIAEMLYRAETSLQRAEACFCYEEAARGI